MKKKRCPHCNTHPALRQLGELDPPKAGWECYVCKRKYHEWCLSDEYRARVSNMTRTYRYSVKPTFEDRWQTEAEFQRILDVHEIKKIVVSVKYDYSCTF
jgi:hypothetical protein